MIHPTKTLCVFFSILSFFCAETLLHSEPPFLELDFDKPPAEYNEMKGLEVAGELNLTKGYHGKGWNCQKGSYIKITGEKATKLDWNKGAISLWIKPEWNGMDGKSHFFFYAFSASDNGNFPKAPSLKFSKGYSKNEFQNKIFIYGIPGSPNAQSSGKLITPFKWVHLAATWDKAKKKMRLFINGIRIAGGKEAKYPNFEEAFKNPTIIIGADQNGECSADGVIDNIKIFNAPLSVSEIKDIFNNEKKQKRTYPNEMEAEILEYLEDQDLAKFENNPWLKVKASSGTPEKLFSKRIHHGFWSSNELPAWVEMDLGKDFDIEGVYVEDSTWEDFGAGKYEILVYDSSLDKFVPVAPPAVYELKNKKQKGHRKIFSFKPVRTRKIILKAYEGRGKMPDRVYLKRICVIPKLSESMKFYKQFLEDNYGGTYKSAWDGEWIWHPDLHYRTPEMKKDFEIKGEIESARLQGNAKNTVEIKVNGHCVYEGKGEPSFSVDIAKYLKQGKNTISADLKNGTWPGGFILETLIKFKGGKKTFIISDNSWETRKKEGSWESAVVLTQDICGRWKNSLPPEDFSRNLAGTLLNVKLPSEVKAGELCVAALSIKTQKKLEINDNIKVDLIDEKGDTVVSVDGIAGQVIESDKPEIKIWDISFNVSRYLLPGKYSLKLKIENMEFNGDFKEDIIGRITVAFPEKPIKNADVEIKKLNGQPAWYVNGKNIYPMFYLYRNMDELKMMRDSGIHLYVSKTHFSRSYWKGEGKYDLQAYERKIREMLSCDPDAYILMDLDVNVCLPWWLEKYPNERCLSEEGKPYINRYGLDSDSFASEPGLKHSCKLVRDIISHFENSPLKERIIGYRVYKSIGGEWYIWYNKKGAPFIDHSPAMKKAFRKYLAQKYKTVDMLRSSWNMDSVDFETAEPPMSQDITNSKLGVFRDLKQEQNVVDYLEALAEINENYMENILKSAKEACKGKKAVGLFYGYAFELWESRQILSGHMNLFKLLKSKTADFLCAPASYYKRYVGEPGAFFSPVDSISNRGVLYFDDSDFRTHLSTINYPHEHLPQSSLSILWRHFGLMLQKNYAFQWHDFGAWFICPAICKAFKKMTVLGRDFETYEEKNNKPLLVPEKDRIAIIVSEKTPLVMGVESKPHFNYYLVPIQREAFPTIGAPFDMVLLEELLERKELNYKAYVFLNAFSLSDHQRRIIKEKIAVNNNVLVWIYAPGIYKGNEFNEKFMRELTGINLKIDKTQGPLQVMVTDTGSQLTSFSEKGDIFGNKGELVWPRIYSDDSECKVLGICPPENRPGLVLKDMGSWKSVYIAAPRVPASIFRGACKLAGIHLYTDKDLALFPNQRYITIYPDKYMKTEIKFPSKVKLFDIINKKWEGITYSRKHELKLLTDKAYIFKLDYENK